MKHSKIMRTIGICSIVIFLLSLIPSLAFAIENRASLDTSTIWENPYTQTTFHSNNQVNSTFYTFPKVIWNGSQFVDYIYNSSEMSGGIGSVYVRVMTDCAAFYDPYRCKERIGLENWTVQYYDQASLMWITDNQTDVNLLSIKNSSGIYFARITTLDSGSRFEEWYTLRIGSRMKITLVLDPALSAEYELSWSLNQVSGNTVRWLTNIENITSSLTITDPRCSQILFGSENESESLVDWSDTNYIDQRTGESLTYFNEARLERAPYGNFCQATITFGSFFLTPNNYLVLDPTIQTLNSNKGQDGYIERYGPTYPPQQGANVNTSSNVTVVGVEGKDYGGLNYHQCRTYLSFDTSTIPALAHDISSTLKIKTHDFNSDENFTVKVWGGNQTVFQNNLTITDGTQPIYGNTLVANSWDSGKVQVATWDTSNYQADIYVNLSISSNQINKTGSTQFEFNSTVEATTPGPVAKYVWFYSGDSQGNEPKLEVSYSIDTLTLPDGETWFTRSNSTSKAVIVIFGGDNLSNDNLYIKSIDFLGDLNDPIAEKVTGKLFFLDALIQNGYSVFTPFHDSASDVNHTYYQSSSVWVQDLTIWLMENQTYSQVFIFGFSGGATVVGNEIQKDYASRFSAAVMNCAPVDWQYDFYRHYTGQIWHTALTASKAKVATFFPENVNDLYSFYNETLWYYNNETVQKKWLDWLGGHGDFFTPNCTSIGSTGDNDSVAVIDWFNATHPPSTPFTPSGPDASYTNTSYGFTSGTIDPNGYNMTYEFDWGDGTNTNTTYVQSGTNVTVYHHWTSKATYNVTVRAEDSIGWSTWCQPKTVTISYERGAGDVNHDNTVDIYDAIIVAGAFASSPGSMNWNSQADLNYDNAVDIYDAIILAGHFGQNYTFLDSPGQPPSGGSSTDSGTNVFVDPSQITVFKGEIFNVTINIGSVTNLDGWEYQLFWNGTILNCTNTIIQSPTEWQNYTQDYGTGLENSYNATHGRYWKAETAAYPASSFNGSMTVTTLTFQAMQPETTSLTLTETKLGDNTGQPITHTDSSGSVTVYYGRYMRGDTITINGLNAYLLNYTESSTLQSFTTSGSGAGADCGIRVWVRHSNGVESEVTLDGGTGTPEAVDSSCGTTNVSQTSLQTTDSLVVRVYVSVGGGAWTLAATFTTEQLNATTLKAATWTVYYTLTTVWHRQTQSTTATFYWGDASHNSRIQNLQYS